MTAVNFVTAGNENLASYRMRVRIPSDLLMSVGYEVTIGSSTDEGADINVYSKHWNMEDDSRDIALTKSKTVFDVCDDHFDRKYGEYYEYMCTMADVVSCNTERMQERIYDVTGLIAKIVPDPITFPDIPARVHEHPSILWFGNAVNINTILPYVGRFPITIVTNITPPDNLPENCNWLEWRPGRVENLIHKYDIVLLPKNKAEWAQTKSPNRAVDSINAGCFVISDFEEVYGNLEDFIYLGDIESGMQFYRENLEECLYRIEAGQSYILKNNNDDIILQSWEDLLNSEKDNL